MRICVFSERLREPFDEGIKNYALNLARALGERHQVLTLTAFAQDVPARGIVNVRANRLLLSIPLACAMRRFQPDLIVYVPTACATLFSFFRSRVLKAYGGGAPVALIALQWRRYNRLASTLMPRMQPDHLFVQSDATRASLKGLASRVNVLAPGIDMARFRPAAAQERLDVRERYGIKGDAYVFLHVGHLNRGRNVQAMAVLQREAGVQAVVVGSASTPHDAGLVAELRGAGVRVIDAFVRDIAEVYRMADAYVFPASGQTSAIDLPLSVLEAMASDLPVITTRYGGLPALFEPSLGFLYVEGTEDLVDAAQACREIQRPGTREMVARYSWPRVAEQLIAIVRNGDLGT